MRLEELAQTLGFRQLTPGVLRGDDVTGGYASDLLSDVLAHAPEGGVLITLQVHLNVIAVASHAGLQAVIFSSDRIPEQDVIDRATGENLCLYASSSDTFEIAGRLYEMGLRGRAE
jgi:hypothetical protein